MLEGKEVEGKIGNEGAYSVDVTEQGKVIVSLSYAKDVEDVKVSSINSVELSLFALLEKAAAKSGKAWTVEAVQIVENLLGIKK